MAIDFFILVIAAIAVGGGFYLQRKARLLRDAAVAADLCKIDGPVVQRPRILFDTLTFAERLQEAGMPEDQAAAVCYATHDAITSALAIAEKNRGLGLLSVRPNTRRAIIDTDAVLLLFFIVMVIFWALVIIK